jgi:hypothetical protein
LAEVTRSRPVSSPYNKFGQVSESLPSRAGSPQAYWDAAAVRYDRNFSGTLIGQTRRLSVWRDLDRVSMPASASSS